MGSSLATDRTQIKHRKEESENWSVLSFSSYLCLICVSSVAKGICLLFLLSGAGCGNGGRTVAVEMLPTFTTKSGVEMVVIPAGYFEMGNKRGRQDEKPVHKVWIDSFLMDK